MSSIKRKRCGDKEIHYYTDSHSQNQQNTGHPQVNPHPTFNLEREILSTVTAQDLVYAILLNPNQQYTKEQVLKIIEKLTQITEPQFNSKNCSYIA